MVWRKRKVSGEAAVLFLNISVGEGRSTVARSLWNRIEENGSEGNRRRATTNNEQLPVNSCIFYKAKPSPLADMIYFWKVAADFPQSTTWREALRAFHLSSILFWRRSFHPTMPPQPPNDVSLRSLIEPHRFGAESNFCTQHM